MKKTIEALRVVMQYLGGWDEKADHPCGIGAAMIAKLDNPPNAEQLIERVHAAYQADRFASSGCGGAYVSVESEDDIVLDGHFSRDEILLLAAIITGEEQ